VAFNDMEMVIMEMNRIKYLIKQKRIIIKGHIKEKIEKQHLVDIDVVKSNLEKPKNLIGVEEQVARYKHDKTYKLCFKLSGRKKLIVIITYKKLKNRIYVVTAFITKKKMDRLIKLPKVKR